LALSLSTIFPPELGFTASTKLDHCVQAYVGDVKKDERDERDEMKRIDRFFPCNLSMS